MVDARNIKGTVQRRDHVGWKDSDIVAARGVVGTGPSAKAQ
jgi:hypothetical protein